MTNSFAESQIAMSSENVTEVKKLIAALVQNVNECPDYDHDRICETGALITGYTCNDVNHDYRCDWFKSINGTVIPPSVTPQDACYNTGFADGNTNKVFNNRACVYPEEYIHDFLVGCMYLGNTQEHVKQRHVPSPLAH